MHILLIALVISSLTTILSLLTLRIKKEDQTLNAVKIFIISFVSSTVGLYIMQKKDSYPEIETGEADF